MLCTIIYNASKTRNQLRVQTAITPENIEKCPLSQFFEKVENDPGCRIRDSGL